MLLGIVTGKKERVADRQVYIDVHEALVKFIIIITRSQSPDHH